MVSVFVQFTIALSRIGNRNDRNILIWQSINLLNYSYLKHIQHTICYCLFGKNKNIRHKNRFTSSSSSKNVCKRRRKKRLIQIPLLQISVFLSYRFWFYILFSTGSYLNYLCLLFRSINKKKLLKLNRKPKNQMKSKGRWKKPHIELKL